MPYNLSKKICSSTNRVLKKISNRSGISLVEAMIGIIIFTLMFVFIFRAFAPTATASHNLLRGTTIAMNACNWYLNTLEQQIQYEGALQSSDLGQKDITYLFKGEEFSEIATLRSLKITSDIKLENNLYNAKVSITWGNKENDKERTHHFEMSRLLIQPDF
jgi:hypothetical protein